jgi:hypothetical protein
VKDITNSEALHMMRACLTEIQDLRRHIEFLTPKVQAYDLITKIFNKIPDNNGGGAMTSDVVWELKKRIRELESESADGEK